MIEDEKKRLLDMAIANFPAEFGLANFPGKVFRISRATSYHSQTYGLMLYTEIKRDDGTWAAFAKGTPAELKREVVKL